MKHVAVDRGHLKVDGLEMLYDSAGISVNLKIYSRQWHWCHDWRWKNPLTKVTANWQRHWKRLRVTHMSRSISWQQRIIICNCDDLDGEIVVVRGGTVTHLVCILRLCAYLAVSALQNSSHFPVFGLRLPNCRLVNLRSHWFMPFAQHLAIWSPRADYWSLTCAE